MTDNKNIQYCNHRDKLEHNFGVKPQRFGVEFTYATGGLEFR